MVRPADEALQRLAALQREQAGVLSRSQVLAAGGDDELIARMLRTRRCARAHTGVYVDRRVDEVAGVRIRRVNDLSAVVHPTRRPPRVRHEHAVVHAASRKPTLAGALALVADECQRGTTTPARLVDALGRAPRLKNRAFLLEVLSDVAAGAHSVLEHRYLLDVERPHGLPTATRQRVVRLSRSSAHRDVEYVGLGTVVELDGRLGHELALDRWADLDRDL